MGLNKEQKAAVEYIEGPLLVLAGPGTGKTQLLSAKVAYILENTDTNPENILCITFTESGASNMRDRLSSMIGRAAGSVHIYTYHAFGSNILERYQNYSETFDRKLDSVIDDVTQYKFIREIQNNLSVKDILKNTEVRDLVETIQHAKSARLSAKDLLQIAERNLTDSTKISAAVTPILQNLQPRMKFADAVASVYQPILEKLTTFTSEECIVNNIEPTANLLARELARLIDEESAKDKPSVSPLTKWKTAHFERDDAGNYRLKDYIANKKLLSLANIMQQYDEKLRREGLFDFADMIEEAIRALREDRGFRLSLSELFQYILLDEFQDTNPSQFELIKLLTDYENPVVMAVGDDDQAIFEFQGANASNLLDFQNHYHAKVITLLDNYRSTGEILDFSHQIAAQVEESFAKRHSVNKVLRSMLDQLHGKSEQSKVSRHEFTAAPDEYYWVAGQIADLIQQGENPDDIAIIAPRHKYIGPILPYLKAHNINVAYEKKSNLLEDPKIHELVTLAETVYELSQGLNPLHRLFEILSFPFLEIDPITAVQAMQTTRHSSESLLEVLRQSEDSKLQQLATLLALLVTTSFNTPLELWFNYLIGAQEITQNEQTAKSPFLDYYEQHSSQTELFEFYENLAALRKVSREHTMNSTPHLADFIETLQDYEQAGVAIMNNSPFQDGAHAVQLMSAHKSKGLEFKHVFLIAVDDLAWGKAKGNNNKFTLPSNLAQIRHTGMTEDERLRLFFVAITRAKQNLVMTNSLQDFSEKKVARLSYLNEPAEQEISPYLLPTAQKIHTHYNDFDVDTRITSTRQGWSAAYQVLTPELEKIYEGRVQNYRMTATDLTSFIDLIYAGPEQIYRQRILRAPDEPLTSQLAYGNLIHSVFEQITNQGIDDAAALELYQSKTLELPLTAHEITELQEKGRHSLNIALQTFRDILRHPHAKGEVNLSSEHLSYDGVPLTGKIDHIQIDPEAKTIEVFDFKTGNYHPEKWSSHPTLYKYALQLGFYKLLLNLSPTYSKYRVTHGHILFVSPDGEDKVYDKVYEYNDRDEAELKQLLKVVYHEISSLDFIRNPEINLSADKARTLKDIKAFVEKLLALDT